MSSKWASRQGTVSRKLQRACAAALGLATFGALTMGASSAAAQECNAPRIMFVVDASSSMLQDISEGGLTQSKWSAVQDAVGAVLSTFPDGAQYGLTTFPGTSGSCDPGVEEVGVGVGNADAIYANLLDHLIPSSSATPAGQTLMEQSYNPDITDPANANYVIFLSDGWQWCGLPASANPTTCATASDCSLMGFGQCPSCDSGGDGCYCIRNWPVLGVEALAAQGVSTFVVGFGDEVDALTLNRAAEAGGNALSGCDPDSSMPSCYLQATSPTELTQTLASIIQDVVTVDCTGPCGIIGSQECGPAGWSECAAPDSVSCTGPCGATGMQQCLNGSLSECDAVCDPGMGGMGGGAGVGGFGMGGAGGGTDGDDDGNSASGDNDPEEDSGCGCRTVGQEPSTNAGAGGLLMLLGLAAMKRRARRARA